MSSLLGPTIVREPLAQPADDAVGLVDRQRGLREVGDPVGIVHLEPVHVLLGLDQDEVVGRLAHRALHLLVALVADQHDRVALGRELLGLHVHLGHQRAGGVDGLQPARLRVGVHAWARLRAPRRRPSRPRAPRSPAPRRPLRGRAAARPRACCARSPCARTPAVRRARARARPPEQRDPRRRSSRAGRRAEASRELRAASRSEASEEPEHGLPGGVEAALGYCRQVVAAPVPASEVEVDEVHRGHPLPEEREVVVGDAPDGLRGEGMRRTRPARRAARRRRQSRASEKPSRGMLSRRSPTKSSSTMARASRRCRAATRLPRRPARSNWESGVPRGLSSPSKRANTMVRRSVRGLIVRASCTATAVPEAPSLAPTKPGRSFVS